MVNVYDMREEQYYDQLRQQHEQEIAQLPKCPWCGWPMDEDHPVCSEAAAMAIPREELEKVLAKLDKAACVERRGAAFFIREKLNIK